MNSYQIKHAVMSYFRFTRQCICATECYNSDVMVYTGKYILDIEIKTNKYDLWRGEARKSKHKHMKIPDQYKRYMLPHKFYICIPPELLEEATKWVKATNDKYGIIEATETKFFANVFIKKTARVIHKRPVTEHVLYQIMKRVCSENINHMGRILNDQRKPK